MQKPSKFHKIDDLQEKQDEVIRIIDKRLAELHEQLTELEVEIKALERYKAEHQKAVVLKSDLTDEQVQKWREIIRKWRE